ncbi:hypothetical protein ACWM35_10370 [Neobacillus sp. K501]
MLKIIPNHPQINKLIELFEKETEPFRKIHRMIDLFETLIKTHTAFLVGNYFHHNEISDEIKELFVEGLRTPSLGTWQLFSRELYYEIGFNYLTEAEFYRLDNQIEKPDQKDRLQALFVKVNERYQFVPFNNRKKGWRKFLYQLVEKAQSQDSTMFQNRFLVKDFYQYFINWDKSVDIIVQKRNKYAHGATPTNEICSEDVKELMPILGTWLNAPWLHKTHILLGSEQDYTLEGQEPSIQPAILTSKNVHNPYIVNNEYEGFSLFPIMVANTKDGRDFNLLFFNDLKKVHTEKISYLHYPYADHIVDSSYFHEFFSIFQLEEWKQKKHHYFTQRIEELTETFKGRLKEQAYIKSFIFEKQTGNLFIYGSPGIGKSAISANVVKNIKGEELHIIQYFIRRGTIFSQPQFFLDYLIKECERISPTTFPLGTSIEEKQLELLKRLQHLYEQDKKVVIFLDGLDEGEEILSLIPRESLSNIIWVFSSRLTESTYKLLSELSIEHTTKYEIKGLRKEDILALLYDVVNKYELEMEYVDVIARKSEGNPLYIKLLCESLESGEIQLNDSSKLPSKIDDFYEYLLDKVSGEVNGNDVLDVLFVIAAAKDYLCNAQLEIILDMRTSDIKKIINRLWEVLFTPEQGEGSRVYQLFHESFRDYLYKNYRNQIMKANLKIIKYCANWEELLFFDESVKEYCFIHYVNHLRDVKMDQRIMELAKNQHYISEQMSVTYSSIYSFQLYGEALAIGLRQGDEDKVQDISTKILKLHHEGDFKIRMNQFKVESFTKPLLTKLLDQLHYQNMEQRITGYFRILDSILTSNLKGKREFLVYVMDDIDTRMVQNTNIINILDYIPIQHFYNTCLKLYKHGISYVPLITRISWKSLIGFRFKLNLLIIEPSKESIDVYLGIYRELFKEPTLSAFARVIKDAIQLNNIALLQYTLEQIEKNYSSSFNHFYNQMVIKLLLHGYTDILPMVKGSNRYRLDEAFTFFIYDDKLEIASLLFHTGKIHDNNILLFISKALMLNEYSIVGNRLVIHHAEIDFAPLFSALEEKVRDYFSYNYSFKIKSMLYLCYSVLGNKDKCNSIIKESSEAFMNSTEEEYFQNQESITLLDTYLQYLQTDDDEYLLKLDEQFMLCKEFYLEKTNLNYSKIRTIIGDDNLFTLFLKISKLYFRKGDIDQSFSRLTDFFENQSMVGMESAQVIMAWSELEFFIRNDQYRDELIVILEKNNLVCYLMEMLFLLDKDKDLTLILESYLNQFFSRAYSETEVMSFNFDVRCSDLNLITSYIFSNNDEMVLLNKVKEFVNRTSNSMISYEAIYSLANILASHTSLSLGLDTLEAYFLNNRVNEIVKLTEKNSEKAQDQIKDEITGYLFSDQFDKAKELTEGIENEFKRSQWQELIDIIQNGQDLTETSIKLNEFFSEGNLMGEDKSKIVMKFGMQNLLNGNYQLAWALGENTTNELFFEKFVLEVINKENVKAGYFYLLNNRSYHLEEKFVFRLYRELPDCFVQGDTLLSLDCEGEYFHYFLLLDCLKICRMQDNGMVELVKDWFDQIEKNMNLKKNKGKKEQNANLLNALKLKLNVIEPEQLDLNYFYFRSGHSVLDYLVLFGEKEKAFAVYECNQSKFRFNVSFIWHLLRQGFIEDVYRNFGDDSTVYNVLFEYALEVMMEQDEQVGLNMLKEIRNQFESKFNVDKGYKVNSDQVVNAAKSILEHTTDSQVVREIYNLFILMEINDQQLVMVIETLFKINDLTRAERIVNKVIEDFQEDQLGNVEQLICILIINNQCKHLETLLPKIKQGEMIVSAVETYLHSTNLTDDFYNILLLIEKVMNRKEILDQMYEKCILTLVQADNPPKKVVHHILQKVIHNPKLFELTFYVIDK